MVTLNCNNISVFTVFLIKQMQPWWDWDILLHYFMNKLYTFSVANLKQSF